MTVLRVLQFHSIIQSSLSFSNLVSSTQNPGQISPHTGQSWLLFQALQVQVRHIPCLIYKLDHSNYLLWETMILPIIRGDKLDGHVLGSKPCPPEFLPRTTPGSTVKIPNPEFEEWVSNHQLLLGWLYSTMSH